MHSVTQPAQDTDRITYGAVHLDVVDIARSMAFWRDRVGLVQLAASRDEVRLGAGGRELIVLHPGAERPVLRGHAGLYHVAVHVPGLVEFGRVVKRFAAARVPQGPTDHVFSMATYVHDPDGIMLEVTLETPERFGSFEITPRAITMRDSEGNLRGPTESLDLEPVLAAIGDGPLDLPMPEGTTVGHVHLHVPDLAAAVAHYRDVIGFDEHMVMPLIGMADLSAGGRFPHRLALNNWQGPAAVQPPAGTAGMRHATMAVHDAGALEDVRERAQAAGVPLRVEDGELVTRDPAGNTVRITDRR